MTEALYGTLNAEIRKAMLNRRGESIANCPDGTRLTVISIIRKEKSSGEPVYYIHAEEGFYYTGIVRIHEFLRDVAANFDDTDAIMELVVRKRVSKMGRTFTLLEVV